MTVQMNHGTNGVVTLQAPSTGTATVTIPARDGTLALGGPAISFNSAGTVLSGSGCTVAEVSTGIYDITRAAATVDAVALLQAKLFTASEIVSNAASTIGGMALLVQAGILSQERSDAILRTT